MTLLPIWSSTEIGKWLWVLIVGSTLSYFFPLSALVLLHLFSKDMDDAQTHFGPMLCMFGTCNGHIHHNPTTCITGPKVCMGKSMVCLGPPNLSWMGKRAIRGKTEVGNTWLLTCPKLLIVGMSSPWGFSVHVKHLPKKIRGWMFRG
jgi:hypothetical protein